jgi:hypothetical protein
MTTAPAETLDLAEHVRDGLWRADTSHVPALDGVDRVLVAGEPAAVNAARIAWSVATPALGHRVEFDAGELDGTSFVLAMSYDGADPRALAAFDGAVENGAAAAAATTGGPLAERARAAKLPVVPLPAGFSTGGAVGYWIAIAAELLARAGQAPSLRAELESGATLLDGLRDDPEPEALAAELRDALAVLVVGDVSSPLAARVASRLIELAGVPAAVIAPDALAPEARARVVERSRAAFLAFGERPGASVLHPRGDTAAARALSTILLADAMSLRLA